MQSQENAKVWGRALWNEALCQSFGSLPDGAHFRFPQSREVHTKARRGWYVDAQGRKWRTGAGTAVVRMEVA